MTKVLFVHDGPRWKDDKGQQFGTATDIEMYNRYLYLGKSVQFAMRVFKFDNTASLLNLNNLGLQINEIQPFNRPSLLKNYFKSKNEIIRVVEEADILVVRLPSTIGSVAVAHAKKINKPYLVEVVACSWDSLTNHGILGKLYAPFSKNKLKKHVIDAPFVIYVTKYFLQNRYPNKFESAGISDVVLKDFPKKNIQFEKYLKFEDGNRIEFTTLGVVNLDYKGHKYVLMAMVDLLKQGYDVYYNIVGGGDNTTLVNLVKKLGLIDCVSFAGKLPHEEVFKVLEKTDIYIQPSETEGLPRALVEAMSRGCVCIGSDAGGIPELLDENAIFKSKNVSDLTAKIKDILTQENLVTHSKKNFEHAKEFSYEKLEMKRHAFYDKFLKSINEK